MEKCALPKIQFIEEFRQEAILQIIDRRSPVAEVSAVLVRSPVSDVGLTECKKQ